MISFLGYTPDLDPATQGVIVDCSNIIPDTKGMISSPSLVSAGFAALADEVKGFAVVRKLDNSKRTFAGTASNMYEASGTTWGSVGSGYTVGADSRWRFAQFGNVSVATSKETTIQGSSSGAFADLTGAPKAAIVETLNNQIFAFNTNEVTYGDSPERWWVCAVGNENSWTPSSATLAASGQLLDAPGPITAGKRLGDIIIAYKDRAMFIGQFVGIPVIWSFTHLPGFVGTSCQEAVVSSGTAHYFIGPDDFYVFDGSRAVPLQSPLRQWFYDNLDPQYALKILSSYDSVNNRIHWWFVSKAGGGVIDTGIAYHIPTNRWGRVDEQIEAAAEYFEPGISYDNLGGEFSTYQDLPTTISYDSAFWNAGNGVVSVFKTDHIAYTYSGTPAASSITTGFHGDGYSYMTLKGVRPRFIVTPTSTDMEHFYSNLQSDSTTVGVTATYSTQGNYDLLWSARWHKIKMNYTGNMTSPGFDLNMTQGGRA
jgi:hypothetical protein